MWVMYLYVHTRGGDQEDEGVGSGRGLEIRGRHTVYSVIDTSAIHGEIDIESG